MNFNQGSQSLGRNASMGGGLEGRRGSRSQLSFSRKFPFVKSTEKLNEFSDNDCKSTLVIGKSVPFSVSAEDPIFSYEAVELQNSK